MAQDVVPINVRALYEAAGSNGDKPPDDESDWARIDLADIAAAMLAGTFQPIMPEILQVTGTIPLFYKERTNVIFGEPGGGKTWVMLAAIAETVRNGHRAMLIDWEDNSRGAAVRSIQYGLTHTEIELIDYRNPSTGIGHGLEHLTAEQLAEYALVVIDSTGVAMAAGGVNPNADEEVTMWSQRVRELAELPGGPAVLSTDHVPKSPDSPQGYAIGSQRKKAVVTGASYRVETIKAFAKGHDGKLKLVVAKDRWGNRAEGTIACEVDVTSIDADRGTLTLTLKQSDMQAARDAGIRWRPTIYMERVSDWLHFHPASSTRAILDGCQGKRDVLSTALETLVEEGYVTVVDGPRSSKSHTVTKRYSEATDPKTILHPTDPGTVPQPFPTVPQPTVPGSQDDPGTVPPPLLKGGTVPGSSDLHLRDQPTTTVPRPDYTQRALPAEELF